MCTQFSSRCSDRVPQDHELAMALQRAAHDHFLGTEKRFVETIYGHKDAASAEQKATRRQASGTEAIAS